MSARLIARSSDLRRLTDEGFELEIRDSHLLVRHVPYVTPAKEVAYGTLVSTLTLAGDTTATPAAGGGFELKFTVSLNKSAALPTTVHFQTRDRVAKAGIDYTGASGTLTCRPASRAACSIPAEPPRTIKSASEIFLPSDCAALKSR